MALGKRPPKQPDLWLATTALRTAPGHPFYQKLNALLDEAGFDPFVEDLCQPYYADGVGRPGIPPPASTSACSFSGICLAPH
jgi:transposase